MNIWIVTIGSSDVQLDSDSKNRKKGRSENQGCVQSWRNWYDETIEKSQCYDLVRAKFEPKQLYKDELYRVAPRLLGTVYEMSTQDNQDKIWKYLNFPLLDNFAGKLKESSSDVIAFGSTQSVIAVLLTDQSEIFKSDQERRKPKSPYWQDTCTLKPILQQYFKDKFPDTKCLWISLSPASSDNGLDDWNYVLDLVRSKLREKLDSEEIKVQPNETVYVSHQAGTPAISSAIQFVSLAQFEERVQFLVSNEQDFHLTKFIESSNYLQGIQLEKAKKLLSRHDYSGVKELLAPYLKSELKNLTKKLVELHDDFKIKELLTPYLKPEIEKIHQISDNSAFLSISDKKLLSSINSTIGNLVLLEAATQWNFAKFEDFQKKIVEYLDEDGNLGNLVKEVQGRTKEENWWWTAYEAAYLAVVRLEQGNTVEAMFHSFRAVEGLLANWIDNCHSSSKRGKTIKLPYEIVLPWGQRKDVVNAYGQGLYFALEVFKNVDKNQATDLDIWTFGNYVFPTRNSLFHKLEGLKDKEAVFEAWKISRNDKQASGNEQEEEDRVEQKWKERVLKCLNFIAEPKPHPTTLEEASLMFKVHKALEDAITQYKYSP